MNILPFFLCVFLLWVNHSFSMEPLTLSQFIKENFNETDSNISSELWNEKVNKLMQNSLKIKFDNTFSEIYYKNKTTNFPEIIITKNELLNLGFSKAMLINTAQRNYVFSPHELTLFTQLSDELCKDLKNYFYSFHHKTDYYDTDYRIKFLYKKKMTTSHIIKTMVNCYQQLLPILVPTLLYHHIFIEDMEHLWTKAQDPLLLEENKKQTLMNNLIGKLQAQRIPNSELLEKKSIIEPSWEWAFPLDLKDTYNRHIRMRNNIYAGLNIIKFIYSYSYCSPQKYWKDSWQETQHKDSSFISFIFLTYIFGPVLFDFMFSPIIHSSSKIIFSQGIEIGLANIIALVSIYGFIKAIAISYMQKFKKRIDFPKDKFKDKTTKEVINYYLNKNTICIQ